LKESWANDFPDFRFSMIAGTRKAYSIWLPKKSFFFCFIVFLAGLHASPAAAASSCVQTTGGWSSMQQKVILLTNDQGKEIPLLVRVADDPKELAAGYQFICPEVVRQSAILFDFGRSFTSRFHMGNVFAPLDIAFFDPSGELVRVEHMSAEPPGFSGKRKLYSAGTSYQYALETSKGYLSAHFISAQNSSLDTKSVR
jgi:uncharacterized membrane protein (UPF0127 family)